eukprot:scaffold60477_cov50-Attheya_sp.AAC.2
MNALHPTMPRPAPPSICMNIFEPIFFAGTRDPRKQLCVARRTAVLIRALKYPHTFEYGVVLQQLVVILVSHFTKAVASLPISPPV